MIRTALVLLQLAFVPPVVANDDLAPVNGAVVGEAAARGRAVFNQRCVLCHGASGKGDGRAAKMVFPPPANLTVSRLSDKFKERIIRNGGEAVGRSSFMPAWKNELTDAQIRDVISFLRELRREAIAAN